jgi:hypothetical protein
MNKPELCEQHTEAHESTLAGVGSTEHPKEHQEALRACAHLFRYAERLGDLKLLKRAEGAIMALVTLPPDTKAIVRLALPSSTPPDPKRE